MTVQISNVVQTVKPSPTFAVMAKAAELRAAGEKVIAMSLGEPDFDTPDHIKAAAIEAINDGFTKYTPVDGIPRLKQAIVNKFKNENDLQFELNQILVSVGGKQSLFNLFQALLNEGDEVVIPAPYWVSYPPMAQLARAVPVIIETDIKQSFKITPEQLDQAITPKTRLFVINSPSNPSGMAYTRDELAALGDVLLKYPDVLVVTDDIYEHIVWPGNEFVNILQACPALYDRCLIVNGVSKAYAMTGWRIGYAAGPANLIGAMKKIQGQSTSNPCSIAQVAAAAALENGTECLAPMITAFKQRHDIVINGLNAIPGFKAIPVDGTFYAYPDISEAMATLKMDTDVEFAEFILTQAKVAVVPGSAFGTPGYIRMSYANSEEQIRAALEQIQAVMTNAMAS